MNIVRRLVMVILASTSILSAQTAYAAEVRSISREIEVEGASEPTLLVRVSCAEVTLEREIQRVGKSGKWCSKELSDTCSIKKVKAAKKVCGTHFGRRLAEYRKANTVAGEQVADTLEESVSEQAVDANSSEASAANLEVATVAVENDQDDQSLELSREMLEIRKQKILIEERKLELELKEIELREQVKQGS